MQAIDNTTTPSHSFCVAAGGFSAAITDSVIGQHLIKSKSFVKIFFPIIGLTTAFLGFSALPGFAQSVQPIPDATWAAMQGKSFHAEVKGCAQRNDLVLVTVPYWNFKNEAKQGQLVVHKSAGKTVLGIFTDLYTDKSYQIERMDLIDSFGGDDRASMNANNTSGYNCRVVAGSARLSSHARGLALDINPLINPYVWKKGTSPLGGKKWDTTKERDAAKNQPGMILPGSAITKAFLAAGWGWGGQWSNSKDYQHFSADGK
jgi:hypothetical protein